MNMKNKRVFCLTEGTIRKLAKELAIDGELSKEQITPQLVEKVRFVVAVEFRNWDTWLKEVISSVAESQSI